MLRKTLVAAALLLVTGIFKLYSAENPFVIPPSAISASYSEGSFSSMLNPVYTDIGNYYDLAYRYVSCNNEDKGNHFASLNLFGFEFIYSRYNSLTVPDGDYIINAETDLYSINRGFFFDNTFGLGAGFSFSRSHNEYFNGFSAWNIGFLYRPYEFLSLGIVLKDINASMNGVNIERTDIYSISIRPWKEYFTFSAECIKTQGDSFSNADFSYSGEFRGYEDVSLVVKYCTDKTFTAGLTVPFFIRNGTGTGIVLDAYGSNNPDSPDCKSAGVAINFKQRKDSVKIAAGQNMIMLRISDNFKSERDTSGFFEKRELTFQDLVFGLEAAGNDPTISGLIVEIDQVEFGMAQIQELRELFNDIRSRGKKIYAILNYPGNREYYLSVVADKIFFTPNSTFEISGLTATAYFIKGLMDKVGVKFESFSMGKYKSANEMFMRKDMSKEARENLKAILEELNEQYIAAIIENRKLTRTTIEELFMKGFYSPAEAKEKGFIDDIMYRDEAVESLGRDVKLISFTQYINEEEAITSWSAPPAIAVITVTGSITSGKGTGSAVSETTGDYDYRASIDAAFTDPSVKAVVIRIDSGGGSAAASDFMWSCLSSAKKKNPKPVVFSFGNTAASGGYYIACTGDMIFADKATITGSIGVVAGKISVQELYSKLGITTETIKMSEFADIFSESRSLTAAEKKLFRKSIEFTYDRFTGKVMEARGITKDEIPDIAEGKIHTGETAKDKKLVDETGGLLAAIGYAKEAAGIEDRFTIINLPETGSIFKGFFSDSETMSFIRYMTFIAGKIEKYRMMDEQVLYIQPYTIRVK